MKIFTIILSFIILVSSCSLFEESDYDKAIFNSETWASYSNSDDNRRYEMINDLFHNYLYKGMSDNDIINLLGNPDSSWDNYYLYYIGWPPNSGSYFRIDGDVLSIEILDSKVVGYNYGES